MRSTAFVTGGSGFLGQHLVRRLVAGGVRVRALARSDASKRLVEAAGAEPVPGELTDPASLDAALAQPTDVVFHAAADTNRWTPNNARQTRINVEGTRMLAETALARGAKFFVHTSSVSSFSHLVDEELTEDSPRRGGESWVNYERTKFLAEEQVRGAMARGLEAAIVHPAHIFGPGDTSNWAQLVQLVDRGQLPGAPPGSGAFADVREVARAQIEAWRRRRSGEAYLLGGEHATFVDLIARIGRELGRRTPRRATPAFVLRAYAWTLDMASRVTGREPAITREAAVFTCHALRVDSSKAMRELDYGITPLDRLLADTIAWMRQNDMLLRA
ncbi:MAG TPA: NAD-dependent epimerase/dehydratase family protein [Candidatus Saccharimonadia bacterium]|nr:NAD-dependent epimerase/dehydratase family protein [Candidatus Saccharimonadia bacterium]